MPALATTTSMPPARSTVVSIADSSAARSVTSASNQSESGPQSAATRASSSGSSPISATRAPRCAARRAASAPIPRAAPVIRTVLPFSGYFGAAIARSLTCGAVRVKAPTGEMVIAVLIVGLLVGGFVLGGTSTSSGGGGTAGARAAAAKVAPIARRVETIRGLRFKHLPKPLIVTAAQTRADSLRDLDRHTTPGERRAAAQVLVLLGLLKPGVDLRAIEGDVAGEQVAGYYDTRRKRLAIVAGAGAADDVTSEITLAHELDHALDDQRIGVRDLGSTGADDYASAYAALVEGVATSVMDQYARRYIDPGRALSSAFATAGPALASTKNIPPYLLASILFSYTAGEKFVNELRRVGHGWKLVNYALKARPPRSTEQVIHPEKYFVDERPVPVPASGLRALLPRGWKRVTGGTVGEFDTDQVLKLGVGSAAAGEAAAGWGGGSYVLWSRGSRSALVLTWAWDTPRDAAQFLAAARQYVARKLQGRATVRSVSPTRTVLAIAPTLPMAERLAAGARLGRRGGG